MINQETLNNLYEGVTDGNELTTKELNSYGFNSKDLSELIEQGVLKRVKRGHYSFLTIDDLLYFGKKLLTEKEYDKANKCFEKCYELNPEHFEVCFQLFIKSISKKDYEMAFEYFEALSNTDNPYYNADNNLYLYLLSIVTDIPEKYKNHVRNLKIEDISVNFDDDRYEDISAQNRIRNAVLESKFPFALKQLRNSTIKHENLTPQEIVIKTLLFQAIDVESLSKRTILEFAKTKQYDEIISYLEAKEERHKLSVTDDYTLRLAKDLLFIKDNGIIPEKFIYQTKNLFRAIDGCNYELALQINENYNKKNNIDSLENTVNLLLSDICNSIDYLYTSSQSRTENEENLEEDSVVVSEIHKKSSLVFSDVITYLMKSDVENAFSTLKSYMNSINKSEYEFLIIELIKLSLMENDNTFTRPKAVLACVSEKDFNFDVTSYIQDFYATLSQNRFAEARIYLDIISKGLTQTLETAEELVQHKRNNELLDSIEKVFKEEKENIKTTVNSPVKRAVESTENSVLPISTKNKKENSVEKITDSEKEFIESKHNLLLGGQGIVLLKPMSSDKRKRIHVMARKYPDMTSFSIGEGKNRQVVLRYKPFKKGFVDIKGLISSGNLAYKEKNYDECIKNFLQVLQFGEPKAFVYANLGLAYMKKFDDKQAIDYFTVATELSKQEDQQFEFTELIGILKRLVPEEDRKPNFKMTLEEFGNDVENYYGIENYDEITTYILESGLDVESACQQLGMNKEQIDTMRLIYAKKYYSQGNYDKGDQFLKTVERSKDKTKFTIKLFDEVRKTKKFYINRDCDSSDRLVLTLQPKKANK